VILISLDYLLSCLSSTFYVHNVHLRYLDQLLLL
jgi:hypothetical protein